ncbi:hypothetical protein D9M72_567840 [compost metagenome]
MDRGLGGAVGAGEGRHQHAGDAADVHHQPAAPAQQREQRAGQADDGEDVGLELPADVLRAAVQQRAHGAVAGVVDQHVEAPGFHLQACDELGDGRLVVDVQAHAVEAGEVQAGDVLIAPGAGPDLVAGAEERLGEGAADAAGAAGDEGDGCGHGRILA